MCSLIFLRGVQSMNSHPQCSYHNFDIYLPFFKPLITHNSLESRRWIICKQTFWNYYLKKKEKLRSLGGSVYSFGRCKENTVRTCDCSSSRSEKVHPGLRRSHRLASSEPRAGGGTSAQQKHRFRIKKNQTFYFHRWTERMLQPQTDLSQVFVPLLFSPAAALPTQPVRSSAHHVPMVLLQNQSLQQALVPVRLCGPRHIWGREVAAAHLRRVGQPLDALFPHQMTWEVGNRGKCKEGKITPCLECKCGPSLKNDPSLTCHEI